MAFSEGHTVANGAPGASRDHDAADHEAFCEPGLPGTIDSDHHALRAEAARIRALCARAGAEPVATLELHARLAVFAECLETHFRSEEATCAATGRHAAATERWLVELAAEHLDLRRRLERLLAEIWTASRERRCLSASGLAGIAAFFEELAAHELSEVRLFELALRGH